MLLVGLASREQSPSMWASAVDVASLGEELELGMRDSVRLAGHIITVTCGEIKSSAGAILGA